MAYTDGLDRVIQTVSLDQHASGTIAHQILYDGCGHPAVTTKPLHTPEISFAYQSDLVKPFDWHSGHMTGNIVDYYRQDGVQAADQKPDDALYPYSRQVAEANPLARIREVAQPGVDFHAGSSYSVQVEYGQTPEANALLTYLKLVDQAGHYTLRTTATAIDFLGHRQASTDSDRNAEQCIYDPAGRLCFKLDAEGAAQSPHRILYWHYDALGRILEAGIVRQEWDREQLQHAADARMVIRRTSRFTPAMEMSEGIGGYDLKEETDRVFAFDYESSGKLDHLVVVGHGAGQLVILKHSAGQFTPVSRTPAQGSAAVALNTLFQPHLVLSPDDRVFAFDYESSGKRDHLVVYAPGTGKIAILKQGFTPVYHQTPPQAFINPVYEPTPPQEEVFTGLPPEADSAGQPGSAPIVPMLGIGGYDLASPADRIFAFDYESSGKLDHLVAYRPGTGAISIIKQSAGQFTPVYVQGDPGSGIGGYDLTSLADHALAFDYESNGKLDFLVFYRPGSGSISFLSASTWTRQYAYDRAPNTATTHLKGRLCEIRTRGDDMKEVRESFAYDLAGNIVAMYLVVDAFDTQTRVTRYEYDKGGNVTKIIYPHDLLGKPSFGVHYFYNTYDHSYDFQGHLLALQDNQGFFSEVLRYRDTNGTFKDGHLASATFTGSAVSSPHAYSYQIVPHPDWDAQGLRGQTIEYDANGNLLSLQQGKLFSTYHYKPGTNQLINLVRQGFS